MGDIMTCKINADTSDGLKIVSDTSGEIDIQSNGTTSVSITPSQITITDADASQPRLLLKNTNADTSSAFLDFQKDSASPANDNLGIMRWIGDDDGGNTVAYATVLANSPDVTDGAEDGTFQIQTIVNGTNATRLSIVDGDVIIAGGIRYNAGYGSSVAAYGCRAWIKLTGTGTIAISASANVASITDRGTGTYTVTFTTAMPDANYSTQVTTTWATGVTEHVTGLVYHDSPYAQATGSVTAKTYNFTGNGAAIDASVVMLAVFR